MPLELTKEQRDSLEDSRKVFNRLTGKRLTLAQFLVHVVKETVETAAMAAPLVGMPAKGIRHVH
jgi:hypothetical protein